MKSLRAARVFALAIATPIGSVAYGEDDDIGTCVRAAHVMSPSADAAHQRADCTCVTPKLKESLSDADYGFQRDVTALIADGTINEIDFHDEVLAASKAHYANGADAEIGRAHV